MIKFFRKIRQNLLSKGETSQYLKYAIGEIVLVVIGILIALSINNWNEERKNSTREQVILKQLKEDYQANLIQLEQKIEMRNNIINSGIKIFKAIDYPEKVNRDSLIRLIGNINQDPTFDPVQNDLTSSGNLRLIKNEKLKRKLSNWSSDIVALTELEEAWSNIVNQHMEYEIAKLGISRDVVNSWINDSDQLWLLDKNQKITETNFENSKHSVSVIEITSCKELEGIVASAISFNKPANIQSLTLVKRINEIIELIDSEIKEK
ncbi:DUF6090 family protein [Psychroserpens algicola]|uniref:DUF6090 family protein n=1 Tax=Psychroserpens algicola TaxID=1719034 RepID=UPI0019547AAC|nr:DUF6090 family protein [Psychroserpens algicola]